MVIFRVISINYRSTVVYNRLVKFWKELLLLLTSNLIRFHRIQILDRIQSLEHRLLLRSSVVIEIKRSLSSVHPHRISKHQVSLHLALAIDHSRLHSGCNHRHQQVHCFICHHPQQAQDQPVSHCWVLLLTERLLHK